MKIKEIYSFLDDIAPYNTQCEWDNSGFMCGNPDAEVCGVVLCLDCTDDVLKQATDNGCNLVICHHPLIFSSLKRIYEGDTVYNAIRSGITVISAHTNLDMAQGGVNDALCDILGIENVSVLEADNAPLLRMGNVAECDVRSFSESVCKKLGNAVKVADGGKNVKRVAVCGGAGGEYIREVAAAGCDTYVTGEAKHHEYLEAKKIGINLIVAGHFSTERIVLKPLCDKLLSAFHGCRVVIAREECPYETVI